MMENECICYYLYSYTHETCRISPSGVDLRKKYSTYKKEISFNIINKKELTRKNETVNLSLHYIDSLPKHNRCCNYCKMLIYR